MDEWKLGDNVCIKQHKTLDERIEAAKAFIEKYKFKIPIVVDGMDNGYDTVYGVWPDRYFIIQEQLVKLLPIPGMYGYSRADINQWLMQNLNAQEN